MLRPLEDKEAHDRERLHNKLLDAVGHLNQVERDKKEANRTANELIKALKAEIVNIARCLKTGEVFEPEGLGLDDE